MTDYHLRFYPQLTALWWKTGCLTEVLEFNSFFYFFFLKKIMYSISSGQSGYAYLYLAFSGLPCLSCHLGDSLEVPLRMDTGIVFKDLMSRLLSNNRSSGYKITSSIINNGCSLQFSLKDLVPLASAPLNPRRQHELLGLQARMSSSNSCREVWPLVLKSY